jgi:hypothetical protein
VKEDTVPPENHIIYRSLVPVLTILNVQPKQTLHILLFTIITDSVRVVGKIKGEFNMSLFTFIPMIIMWLMAVTLFVLVVIALIELIKFLKFKNAAFELKDTKTNEETRPKNVSL